jgi:hypothetical protein
VYNTGQFNDKNTHTLNDMWQYLGYLFYLFHFKNTHEFSYIYYICHCSFLSSVNWAVWIHLVKISLPLSIMMFRRNISPCLLVRAEIISSTLKMEAIHSSETSVLTQQTTQCHIPEDDTLQFEYLFIYFYCLLLFCVKHYFPRTL